MDANIEALLRDAATAGAALRRLEFPRVRNQEFATSFCRFVANHSHKRRRRTVENGAVETRLLGDIATRLLQSAACRSAHVAHRKLLGGDSREGSRRADHSPKPWPIFSIQDRGPHA